jgi:hypothetical protein
MTKSGSAAPRSKRPNNNHCKRSLAAGTAQSDLAVWGAIGGQFSFCCPPPLT